MPETRAVLPLLRELRLFRGLPENILLHFAEKSRMACRDKGALFFIQGDSAEWFYAVASGWVKIFRETAAGAEAVLDVRPAGNVFGETGIMTGGVHGYGAEAVTETRYIAMPSSLLSYYIERNHTMAANMMAVLAQTQTMQSREIEHLTVQKMPQRIGCFLLKMLPPGEKTDIAVTLPYDKNLIAAQLGMKPETFSRALSKLRDETGITVEGYQVFIPAADALKRYICGDCSQQGGCHIVE